MAIDEGAITRGQNVRATLTAVTEGDAVAAIVYATDAAAAGDAVHLVEIPAGVDIVAAHPIGVVRGTGNQALARAFVDHVLGDGQAVLAEHGFEPPR